MKPDCVLIRVGEQSLKSEQVLRIFEKMLIRNMKEALKGIEYSLKRERSRYFIYSKDIEKVIDQLKRVFGITSISPCYETDADIEKIKILTQKIFKPEGTFAIRARRSGNHKFTSMEIAQKVGYIIKAKADLDNPQNELFIECRQDSAYLFFEKNQGIGGLPLGSAGKVFAYLNNTEDLVAAWLMARRGCKVTVLSGKKELIEKLKKWHIGLDLKCIDKILTRHEEVAIVMGEKTYNSLKKMPDMLILRPLVGFNENKINKFLKKINE